MYVVEAHASDQWPLGKRVCVVPQHKTLEDRMNAAKLMISERKYRIPLVVDPIENNFEEAFCCWPERFYIVQNNKIAWIAQPGEFGDTSSWTHDIRTWLQRKCGTIKTN